MFGRLGITVCLSVLVAGCVSNKPVSPMEAYLNRYAAAEVVAAQCPAYGGYASAASLRKDADTNILKAKKLGATEEDLKAARARVNGQMGAAVFFVGPFQACNQMINGLAWAGTGKPGQGMSPIASTLPPGRKKP